MKMESQDLSQTIVRHERSYLSCLSLGWQVAMNNIGLLLRYAWPSMLFTLVLPIPGIFFFAGQMDALLCRWIELGYVPSATAGSLRKDILYRTCRNLWWILFGIVAFLIAAAATYAIMRLGLGVWWYWGAMLALLFLFLPAEFIAMELSYTRKPTLVCLLGYVVGLRHYGMIFVFELVGLIFTGAGFILGSMPVFAISAVAQQAMQARSIGDAIDLPITFPIIVFLAYVIAMFVFLLCHIIYSFCHCLLWGSITTREEGRKQQLEQENDAL